MSVTLPSTLWLFLKMLERYPDMPDFDIAVNIADTPRIFRGDYRADDVLPLVISPARTHEEVLFSRHDWCVGVQNQSLSHRVIF